MTATTTKTTTIVTPSPGRVLLFLEPEKDRTAGGLYIPNPHQGLTVRRAIVRACGESPIRGLTLSSGSPFPEPEPEPEPLRFAPGAEVLVSTAAGVDIAVDGEVLRLVLFEDVLATVTRL